jgi:hypothetical protein
MIPNLIDQGSIIGDIEGQLWRVLETSGEGLFMLLLPERGDLVHTRTVTWREFANYGYEVVFP